jgi:hypothetical protein
MTVRRNVTRNPGFSVMFITAKGIIYAQLLVRWRARQSGQPLGNPQKVRQNKEMQKFPTPFSVLDSVANLPGWWETV